MLSKTKLQSLKKTLYHPVIGHFSCSKRWGGYYAYFLGIAVPGLSKNWFPAWIATIIANGRKLFLIRIPITVP